MSGTAISLAGLSKHYGDVTAVDDLDLQVAQGEFFSMLGPSGSGKTTVLRMIAGFEPPTAGRIELAGTDVTRLPAHRRDVNTVFQDYALFPHLSVRQNVEYGLRVKKVAAKERRHRAEEALATVRLDAYADRRPHQLSGGQRQRVALARALVNRPQVLLLDEPLGALDLKLRREMQLELKQIQREVGITFVFVTHDQEEALTMSDRIAVFNAGRIEQLDTPAGLYENPRTPFVAGFVGTSNSFSGAAARTLAGSDGTFVIRPERLSLTPLDGGASAAGVVREVVYLGAATHTIVELDAGPVFTVSEPNRGGDRLAHRDDRVQVHWLPDHLVPLAASTSPSGATAARPVTLQEER
jgi:putative spermidine/putrescine transport system ATP-binding protein